MGGRQIEFGIRINADGKAAVVEIDKVSEALTDVAGAFGQVENKSAAAQAGIQRVGEAADSSAKPVEHIGTTAAQSLGQVENAAAAAQAGIQRVGETAGSSAKPVEHIGVTAAQSLGQVENAAAAAQAGILWIGEAAARSTKPVEHIGTTATQSLGQVENAAAAAQAGILRVGETAGSSAKPVEHIGTTAAQSLGQVENAAAAAQAGILRVGEAAGSSAKPVEQLGMTSKATAAALRNVPAQFTDIVVGLQSGQSPLTVLLQQGGQLKDMFGGIGPAARALGGYVAGLVNPFSVAAAAAGTLAVAYYQGSKEASRFSTELVMTGNAVGMTVDKLATMAQAMSAATRATQAFTSDALAQVVATGRIASENVGMVAEAAVRMERTTGQSVSETIKQFVELGKEPVKASEKLNETANYLTADLYKQIKALDDHGKSSEAAALAQKAWADALTERSAQVKKDLGYIETALGGVTDAAKSFWDALLGVGRDPSKLEQIAELEQKAAPGRGIFAGLSADDKERLASLKAEVAAAEKAAKAKADGAASAAATVTWLKEGEKYLSKAEQRERAIAKAREDGLAARVSAAEIETRIAAIRDKYKDEKKSTAASPGEAEIASIKATTQAQQQYLATLREYGEKADKLTEGDKLVIKIQRELETSINGVTRANKEKALAAALILQSVDKEVQAEEKRIKAQKELNAERTSELQDVAKLTATVEQHAAALEAENSVWGKGKVAVEELTLAKIKEKAATLALFEGSQEMVDALNSQIAAHERYLEALKDADYKKLNQGAEEWLRSAQEQARLYGDEAALAGITGLERAKIVAQRQVELELAKKIAEIDRSSLSDTEKEELTQKARDAAAIHSATAVSKEVLKEWDRVTDEIGRGLTDSIFQGGRSGWQQLKKTIEATVIRATVQPAVTSVVGGALQSVGLGPSAGGTFGGVGNLLSTGSSLAGMGGVSAYSGAAGYLQFGSMASSFGTGLTAAAGGADLAAAISAYEAAGMGATAASLSAGASAASVLGGAASTVGSAISALSAAAPYLAIGLLAAQQLGVFDGPTYHHGGAYVADTAGGSSKLTTKNYEGFDLSWGAYNSDRSAAFDEAMRSMSTGIAQQLAASIKQYGGDASGLSVASRFASDNSDYSVGALRVKDAAGQVIFDLDKHYAAQAEKGMQEFAGDATRALVGALKATKLGDEFAAVFASVDPLTSSIEALNAALTQAAAIQQQTESIRSAVDSNFLVPSEQLNKAFEKLGVSMPASASAYETLVRAQDLTTAAGREMAAALMSVYPLWGQVQDAATQAADAAVEAARQASEALRGNLVSAISAVAGSIADMRTRVRDADAAVLSARSAIADATVAAGQKAADAQSALVALLEQSAAATRSFGASLTSYIAGLSSSATGSMSPEARYRSLGAQLQTTSVLAQAGDQASRDKLTSVADAFLQASKARSTTSVDYARDAARVRVMLQGVVDGLTTQVLSSNGTLVTKPIADVGAGQSSSQDQQIAAALATMNVAQADYQRYLTLAAATGTEIKASTDAVGDEIAKLRATYDASASAQAGANAQLQVALQALGQLGLTEEVVKLLAAGLDGGPLSDFATALGVSTDSVRGLQAALGLTDDALAGLAGGLNLTVSDAIYTQLGMSLGVPADLLASLAASLDVSPLTMQGFSTALGWDAAAGAALATAMGWDQTAAAQLGTSIGFSDEATALVETAAAGVAATDSAVALTDALVAGVMTTQAADALTGAMRAGVGISQAAADWLVAFGGQTAALGKLSLVLGVSPAAQQAIDLFSSVSATAKTYGSLVDGAYQDAFGRQADAAGKQYWMGQLYAGAVTQDGFMAAFLAGATGNDREKALAYGHKLGLPGFAVGTNFVVEDMPAIIHRGERIMPAADNAALFEMLSRGSGGNADVVEVLRSLLAELAEIKRSNASMSKVLTMVTRGGDRLLTAVV
ncbi:MAG: phage tail length tape measure family protein [Proteobacteria bacterium]|nr:phage tail length tape measure family protein [Pseudomonadota bacterium]